MRSFIKNIFIVSIVLTSLFCGAFTVFAAGNIDSIERYSQFVDVDLDKNGTKDFIKWNLDNTSNGATVTDHTITGNIWGETVGWINLGPFTDAGASAGVKNTCEGELSGFAWGENAGWINFGPFTNPSVQAAANPHINISTGAIDGNVWSQNYGWIELASPDGTNSGLVTDWRPSGNCSDVPPPPPPPPVYPTITVKKIVVGGSATPSNFTLSIKANGSDINGSPFYGSSNGTTKEVNLGVSRKYVVSEIPTPDYTATFSGDCNASGLVTFVQGDEDITKLCIVTNTYKSVIGYACKDSAATNYNSNPVLLEDNDLCSYDNGGTACKIITALNYNSDPKLTADNTKCKYPNLNPDPDPDLDLDPDLNPDPNPNPDPNLDPDPNPNPNSNPKPNPGSGPFTENQFLAALKNGMSGKSPLWPAILGIIGLASSVPGIITRAAHVLFTFVWGRKKIRGIVYDSNTKEPLDPVYVSVIDLTTNQEVKNQLTDMEGRFGFVLPKGHYKITAGKTNYLFPSAQLAGRVSDEVYDRLYFGEPFTVENEDQVVSMNIPMDPVGTDWNQVQKHRSSFLRYLIKGQTKFVWLFNTLFIIGFLASIMITYFYPVWWNYAMTALYVVIGLIQVYGHGAIHAGKVTKGGQPLAYGIVRIWSASLNREIAKKVIESTGYYYVLVPKADYFVTIDQRNPDGTYTNLFTSNVFHARNGVINKSFDL